MEKKECRIVLVDDHSLFRNGLRGLLDRCEGYRVVAEAASGEEFLALLPGLETDVVFMDFSMPGIDGARTTERALAQRPELKSSPLDVRRRKLLPAYGAGRGAGLPAQGLRHQRRAAGHRHGRGRWQLLQPAAALVACRTHACARGCPDEQLSEREREILVAVCRGLSNQEIADELFISKRTVDKHRANILEKTGCKNTASLVVYAIRHGIVDI